eukprot:1150870-Pelagomonas_calceolata.AAC.7
MVTKAAAASANPFPWQGPLGAVPASPERSGCWYPPTALGYRGSEMVGGSVYMVDMVGRLNLRSSPIDSISVNNTGRFGLVPGSVRILAPQVCSPCQQVWQRRADLALMWLSYVLNLSRRSVPAACEWTCTDQKVPWQLREGQPQAAAAATAVGAHQGGVSPMEHPTSPTAKHVKTINVSCLIPSDMPSI